MQISSTHIPPSVSAIAVVAVALALLVLLAPFSSVEFPSVRVGGLLAIAALDFAVSPRKAPALYRFFAPWPCVFGHPSSA